MSQQTEFVHPDEIRASFAHAMSQMYKREVPQYQTLCDLVDQTNRANLRSDSNAQLFAGQKHRLDVERHGAIRVGTASELAMMRRLFRVMGMVPVGYYDLSEAGVPVHATAFRPVEASSIERNPFRVFTSLLRLELVEDQQLRDQAIAILQQRDIFTSRCRQAIEEAEAQGGLRCDQAEAFVEQALETFRWHSEATVDLPTYARLRGAHPLVADIVCFKGPHINHLTPRTLDIDEVHDEMASHGMRPKDSIEGPPARKVPILLRQTSFLALEERVVFPGQRSEEGTHTARFGEVEQRGCALTRQGRALYDELLHKARTFQCNGMSARLSMEEAFSAFPDDLPTMFAKGLVFVGFSVNEERVRDDAPTADVSVSDLVSGGWLSLSPMIYEDFLPVSAAGIFRSNLGSGGTQSFASQGDKAALEAALGTAIQDEFLLYAAAEQVSLAAVRTKIEDLVARLPV